MAEQLRVSCATCNLHLIRSFVENQLKKSSMYLSEPEMLVLAVDEICTNLIVHSNKCNANKTIEVKIEINSVSVIFEICDWGESFDYKSYREPKIEQVVNERRRGGMGLILVRRIMDEVQQSKEGQKNIFRLYKYFRPQGSC